MKDAHVAACYGCGTLGCEEVAGDGGVIIRAFFSDNVDLSSLCAQLSAAAAGDISITPVVAQDWNRTWRESITPVKLTSSIWVSPIWLPPPLEPGQHWIRIEPKMAFGTGHHETTRLAASCMQLARRRMPRAASLLDIGTGSGVLCFAGQILGFSRILGVEIDGDCRENLAENLSDNCGAASIRFVIGTLDQFMGNERYDLIVMNMLFVESAPLLKRVATLLAPQGRLVWSGILHEGRGEAVAAAAREGFALESERQENEWWAGVLEAERRA
jgi:ribosomal protein L11 methyltransferase